MSDVAQKYRKLQTIDKTFKIFNHNEFTSIRAILDQNNQLWFEYFDIIKALNIVFNDEFTFSDLNLLKNEIVILEFKSQNQSTYIINESGLNKIISKIDSLITQDLFKYWIQKISQNMLNKEETIKEEIKNKEIIKKENQEEKLINNNIKIFENENFGKIRIILDENNNPWWIAIDICKSLGLNNITEALRTLKDNEKMTFRNTEGHSNQRGGAQFFILINEPGLYKLIFKSRKVEAEKFQDWIFYEILPSIRKTGSYSINNTPMNRTQFLAQALIYANEEIIERDKLINEKNTIIENQTEKIKEDKPKVEFHDRVANSTDTIELGEMAKILKQNNIEIGRNRFIDDCREKGYLMGSRPTQKSMDLKVMKTDLRSYINAKGEEKFYNQTVITSKGIKYFLNKYLENKL
jgi:anti-repressor protein